MGDLGALSWRGREGGQSSEPAVSVRASPFSALRVALCFLSRSRFFLRAASNNVDLFQKRGILFIVAFVPS